MVLGGGEARAAGGTAPHPPAQPPALVLPELGRVICFTWSAVGNSLCTPGTHLSNTTTPMAPYRTFVLSFPVYYAPGSLSLVAGSFWSGPTSLRICSQMGRLALVCIEQPTGLALNYITAFIIVITAEK